MNTISASGELTDMEAMAESVGVPCWIIQHQMFTYPTAVARAEAAAQRHLSRLLGSQVKLSSLSSSRFFTSVTNGEGLPLLWIKCNSRLARVNPT